MRVISSRKKISSNTCFAGFKSAIGNGAYNFSVTGLIKIFAANGASGHNIFLNIS